MIWVSSALIYNTKSKCELRSCCKSNNTTAILLGRVAEEETTLKCRRLVATIEGFNGGMITAK